MSSGVSYFATCMWTSGGVFRHLPFTVHKTHSGCHPDCHISPHACEPVGAYFATCHLECTKPILDVIRCVIFRHMHVNQWGRISPVSYFATCMWTGGGVFRHLPFTVHKTHSGCHPVCHISPHACEPVRHLPFRVHKFHGPPTWIKKKSGTTQKNHHFMHAYWYSLIGVAAGAALSPPPQSKCGPPNNSFLC